MMCACARARVRVCVLYYACVRAYINHHIKLPSSTLVRRLLLRLVGVFNDFEQFDMVCQIRILRNRPARHAPLACPFTVQLHGN